MRPPTLLTTQLGRVHRLAEHLDRNPARLVQSTVLLVVLLQQTRRTRVVGTDTRGLPAAVVARRVGLVELELALGVPAGVDEGDSERAQTTVLCVALLQVAQPPDQLLAGNVLVVGQEVALGGLAGIVDEDIGVGVHSCYSADHVAMKGRKEVHVSWRSAGRMDARRGEAEADLTHSFRM